MSRRFTDEALKAINQGDDPLRNFGIMRFETEDLLYGVIMTLGRRTLELLNLEDADLDALLDELRREGGEPDALFDRELRHRQPADAQPDYSGRCEDVLEAARSICLSRTGQEVVGIEHLLEALVEEADGHAATLIQKYLKPHHRPGERRPELDRDFKAHLRLEVVAQKEAVTRFADSFRTIWEGEVVPDQPVAVYWFVGPPGVGKADLAVALQGEVFRDSEALVRIDMSQIETPRDVTRLVGTNDTPGLRDSDGLLTEAVKENGQCVLLLTDFDQAHPDAQDLLTEVCNHGQLVDGRGHGVDFSGTVIIMTSDVGPGGDHSAGSAAASGPDASKSQSNRHEGMPQAYHHVLVDALKPELLESIDDVIAFRPLPPDARLELLDDAIQGSVAELEDSNLAFVLARDAREWFFRRSGNFHTDPWQWNNLVEDHVSRPFFEGRAKGQYPDHATILIETQGDRIAFRRESRNWLSETFLSVLRNSPIQHLLVNRKIEVRITNGGAEWLADRVCELPDQGEFYGLPDGPGEKAVRRLFGDSMVHAARRIVNRFLASPIFSWYVMEGVNDQAIVQFGANYGEWSISLSTLNVILRLTDLGDYEWWIKSGPPHPNGIPVKNLIDAHEVPRSLVSDVDDYIPESLWELLSRWMPYLPRPTIEWALARSSDLGLVWPARASWYWRQFPDHPSQVRFRENRPQGSQPPSRGDDTFNNYYLIDPPDEDDEDEDDDA